MENVNIEEAVANAVPIAVSKKMTRAEKLNHWADLVRNYRGDHLRLGSNIEYLNENQLRGMVFSSSDIFLLSAFNLAVRDETFREQGLPNPASLRDIMNFMEIDADMLHEFSCDCGGAIGNRDQADRIASLVNRKPAGPGLIQTVLNAFR